MVYGSTSRLVISKQTHFQFDSVMTIRMNPNAYLMELVYYVDEDKTDKPTIIFTDAVVTASHFPETPIHLNVLTGASQVKVVNQPAKRSMDLIGTEVGCKAFTAWNQLNIMNSYPKVAIVFPRKYFCPSATAAFHVVMGDYDLMSDGDSKFGEQYLEPKWEKRSAGATFGNLPAELPAVPRPESASTPKPMLIGRVQCKWNIYICMYLCCMIDGPGLRWWVILVPGLWSV